MTVTTIRVDDNALYPREFKRPTLRTLKYEAYYRDINSAWSNGIQELVEDDAAIQRQIANLLGTPKGTEHHEPMFGCDLPYRLMESITPMMAVIIETDVFVALHTWMRDRVLVNFARSSVTELDYEDGYLVDLFYMQLKDSKLVTYKFEVVR